MSKPLLQNAHTRSKNLLCVFPNVYAAVDHLGRLSGAVRFDPEHGRSGSIHFVGATVTRTPIEGFVRTEQREKGARQTMYDTTVQHSLEEVQVPHTDFFVRQIRDGSLIPANVATAQTAKVKFVEPALALAAKREQQIKELLTQFDQPTVDEIVAGWPNYAIGSECNDGSTDQSSAALASPIVKAPEEGKVESEQVPAQLPPKAPDAHESEPAKAVVPAKRQGRGGVGE